MHFSHVEGEERAKPKLNFSKLKLKKKSDKLFALCAPINGFIQSTFCNCHWKCQANPWWMWTICMSKKKWIINYCDSRCSRVDQNKKCSHLKEKKQIEKQRKLKWFAINRTSRWWSINLIIISDKTDSLNRSIDQKKKKKKIDKETEKSDFDSLWKFLEIF